MALHNSKILRVFGWVFVVLAVASFGLRVLLAVTSGAGTSSYTSGTGVPWHYSSALVVLVLAAIVLAGGFFAWVWRRIRRHRSGR